ncbi:MAG TPA: 4-hydroxythreonine-4-phosphate dehydrogenase PdxA [Methylomirabilota bacterium]|nr:4-hydroxythreonine-4-phosphate dehydrogenase PdxA [Methylomirabilota bacterium]
MLAIALGDPTGIGPEVALKAVAAELSRDDEHYLLIGDERLARDLNARFGLGLQIGSSAQNPSARVGLQSPGATLPANLLAGDAAAAQAALAALKYGAQLCLRGEASALVTAPVNKEAIIRAGETGFVGQTELLSGLAGTDRTTMMLLGNDDRGRWLRVALATIHVPIREVAARLQRERIELAIALAAQACHDLGLPRSRVAVCGLNPHAGEGGKIGDEEITTITPAVEAMKTRGFDVHGPFAADALFYYVFRGDYDAVVAMYHDQGLVPLKMIGFESGVNWTLGLPFIRTSPDHGTAYDIAGKGVANPSSMIAAIRLAKQLAKNRGQAQ